MTHHRLRALFVALAAILFGAAPASAAISQADAGKRALTALGAKKGTAPVVVFKVSEPLGGGTVITQAGNASAPTPEGKIGNATTTAPVLLRVGSGHSAWAFYADWAPYQAYAHRGQVALVDTRSGGVRTTSFLASPPVIDGRLPEFMRSGAAYRSARNRIFERTYEVDDTAALQLAGRTGISYKLDRAPLQDQALAKQAADQLAADHACVLRVSDTYGEFYDFTGADNTRARLGDLLYVLRQLNPGIVDERYSRTSGESPIETLRKLITEKGCQDLLVYIAGRGFSSGPETTVGIGTRVRGRGVTQQLVRASDLEALIKAYPQVRFSIKVDAPYSKGFVDLLAKLPNVLLAETAAGTDGTSFGYLPYVSTSGGKRLANTSNPDGLLAFTNRTISGITRFLTSADEVAAAIAARKNGASPSFLSSLLGRAYSLGAQDDLPATAGIYKPFFSPTPFNPKGQPPAAPPAGASNHAPLVTPTTVTTPEDTPVTLTVGAADPDGDGLSLAIVSGPSHGTAVITGGLQVTYTPDPDYAGPDSFDWKVNDGHGHNPGHTVTLIVTGVNDKPRITTTAGSANFTEAGAAVAVDPTVQVVDVDDTTLTGATAQITAGLSANDALLFTNQNGITGAYNAATGLLTLTGSASVANYQAALRSVKFQVTGANPAGGARTVAFTASDAAGAGAAATRTVNVTTINDAPVLANSGPTVSYTENAAPATLDTTFTITDPDSPTMTGATVSITGGFQTAEDRLRFTNQNGITGAYNTATGVLTLSGSATRANYETALKTVAYENLSDNPSTSNRTISSQVNDGGATANLSNIVTDTVSITAVNDAPTVTTSSGTAAFTENGAAVAIDPAIATADVDNANLASATVSITGGTFAAGDVLAFTNQNGITGSYNAGTGVLTLTGSASVANYQTALRSITFSTPSDNPTTTRTVSFVVNDGALASTTATRGITITPVNDAPVLAGAGGTTTYTENLAAVAVATGITVSDVDNANLASASVAITGGTFAAGDVLAFTNQNGITGSYNAGTGLLSLSGSATLANYQTALRSITFSTPSDNPSTTPRTITFTGNDGAAASTGVTSTVNVSAVNDAPTVATSGGSASFTENGSAVVVDSGLTVADVDSASLSTATIAIGTGFASGDVLGFLNTANITGSYNAGTGVLTLTGTDTVAAYQAALRSITFTTPSDNPPASKTIGFQVSDTAPLASSGANRTVAITAVNDAPTTGGAQGAVTFTENGPPVVLNSGLTVSDVDNTSLVGASVGITAPTFVAGDTLHFTNQNGITGSYNAGTGVLSLTGTATLANYQTALRSITYSTADDNPSTVTRSIGFVVDDGSPANNLGGLVSQAVDVTPVNDAPVLTTTGGTTNFGEGDAATAIDTGITVADPDSANITVATVSISSGLALGDTLGFSNTANITGSYNAGTGVLTLTGPDTLAAYQAALRTVTFFNASSSLPSANRTISFVATDGTTASSAATKIVHFAAINSAPVVTATGGSTAVSEGSAGAVIDAGIGVSDADDANLAGATVAITAGRVSGDTLQFTNQNGITGSYNSSTGVLTLSGTTTVANYGTAFASVKFSNAGPSTPSGTRTITFTATDSSSDSGSDTQGITFTAVDDGPVVTTSAGSTAYTENDAPTVIDASLIVSDPDSTNLASAQVSITDAVAGDRLGVSGSVPGGFTVTGQGTTTIDISGAKTPTEYRDLMRQITFESTSDNPTSATRHVRFKAADVTTTTTASPDKSVAVSAVNDLPVGVTDNLTTDEDTVKLADVRSNDVDADDATNTLQVDRVNGSAGNVGVQVTLGSGAKVTIDANGNLSYDPRGVYDGLQVGDPDATDSVTYRVKDPQNGTSNTVTVNFTITPVNDAPSATARTFNAVANAALELEPAANSGITDPKERIDGDLLQGASDPDDAIAGASITDETVATTGGGSVDIDPDGSFVYTSEPGENALTDSFTFHIKDTHGATSSQTVTLNLKARVFFVDADNAGAADGTSLHPFTTVQAATTAASTNETVYVADSTPQTASAATLKNGQTVTGAGLPLTANLGATGTPTGTVTLKAATSRPVLSASSGSALTLASGNTVQGLDIDPSGTAKGISAASAGTVSISDVAVNDQGTASAGTGVDLAGAAGTISNLDITTQNSTGLKLAGSSVSIGTGSSINATGGPAIDSSTATGGTLAFGNVSSSNSSTTGISLGGAAAFSATGGSVSGSSGIGVDVSGGAAAISYPGAISPDAGVGAARVQTRSGGTTTLSGNLTTSGNAAGVTVASNTGGTIAFTGGTKTLASGTSNAVSLSNNTGATVQFTGGGLAATSTTGDAFRATGGGTVTVSGSSNTLSAGSGAALHVDSTNTSGLTFQSIADTGGSEGIYLSATGAGASLSVTGDATTTRNTSGGTITSVTGADSSATGNGVYLNDTDGVSLEQMRITGSSNHGIVASNVNGLTFQHGQIDSNGDNSTGGVSDSNVRMTTATGTLKFDDNAISTPQTDNLYLTHNAGSATLQVTNSTLTMDPNRTGSQNDGVLVDGGDAGSLTATVTGNTFTGAAGDHLQLAPGGQAGANSAAWDANIANNTFTSTEGGTGEDLGGGVTMSPAAFNGTFDYTIDTNIIKGAHQGAAINANQGSGTSTVGGTITGNTIGINGDPNSASSEGSGIVVDAGGTTGTHNVLIQNNTVHGNSEAGIIVEGAIAGTTANAVLNATVKGNTIGTPSDDASFPSLYGLYVNIGIQTAQTSTSCVDVQGNTFSGTNSQGYIDLRMRKRAGTTVQLPGYGGAATDDAAVSSYLSGRNTMGSAGLTITHSGAGGNYTNGGAGCPQP